LAGAFFLPARRRVCQSRGCYRRAGPSTVARGAMRNVLRRAALGIAFVLVPMRVPADGGSQRSIILFRNQHPEVPARTATTTLRAATIDAEQAGVASTLARGRAGDVRRFHVVNALAATISSDQAAELRARDDVLAVVPDLPLRQPGRGPRDT